MSLPESTERRRACRCFRDNRLATYHRPASRRQVHALRFISAWVFASRACAGCLKSHRRVEVNSISGMVEFTWESVAALYWSRAEDEIIRRDIHLSMLRHTLESQIPSLRHKTRLTSGSIKAQIQSESRCSTFMYTPVADVSYDVHQ
nr:hypothetical protein CFP56_36346 [Quercus suber]